MANPSKRELDKKLDQLTELIQNTPSFKKLGRVYQVKVLTLNKELEGHLKDADMDNTTKQSLAFVVNESNKLIASFQEIGTGMDKTVA